MTYQRNDTPEPLATTPTEIERIASLERRLAAAISLIETMVEHEARMFEKSGLPVAARQVRKRIALMKE